MYLCMHLLFLFSLLQVCFSVVFRYVWLLMQTVLVYPFDFLSIRHCTLMWQKKANSAICCLTDWHAGVCLQTTYVAYTIYCLFNRNSLAYVIQYNHSALIKATLNRKFTMKTSNIWKWQNIAMSYFLGIKCNIVPNTSNAIFRNEKCVFRVILLPSFTFCSLLL